MSELKLYLEETFPTYKVVDITKSLSTTTLEAYINSILNKPYIILIAKKTSKNADIFSYSGFPHHEYMIYNRDNFLSLSSDDYKQYHVILKTLDNECDCCICLEEARSGICCFQCGTKSCENCIKKWIQTHECFNCPICKLQITIKVLG